MICDIKNCKGEVQVGWNPEGQMEKAVRVCMKHWDMHCDDNNSFSLWKVSGVKKPEIRKEVQELENEFNGCIKKRKAKFKKTEGGTKVKCEDCGHYDEKLLARIDKINDQLTCSKCGGKLIPILKGKQKMAKKKAKVKKVSKKVAKKKTKVSTKRKITTTVPGPRLVGTVSGLGIKETWVKVFEDNFKNKLTDKQITALMHKNYPDRNSPTFEKPRIHRSMYNRGVLTDSKPKRESVAYDAE